MKIDFSKGDGLIPAIIQDSDTKKVLMLGYMNEEAYHKTVNEKKVTFFSRSRQELWTKGETSGNELFVKDIRLDCDSDTLLIKAKPSGPVCHTGQDTCFDESNQLTDDFLSILEKIIEDRKTASPEESYTAKLLSRGINKISQKVGEEATEVIIAALQESKDDFKNEVADLLYHLLVLLQVKGVSLSEINAVLAGRHQPKEK
jgi:phosphoribosyl-ATP pyrophosphohydrolase/phosphoribosyl-AMP cyclohydrolase